MAILTRVDGGGPEAAPVAVRDKLTIGRSRENTLMLEDAAASRRHARIVRHEQGYQLVDLGSENGTWVGDRRVQEHWLRSGDLVRIGEAVFRFTSEAGDPEGATSRSPTVIVALLALAVG